MSLPFVCCKADVVAYVFIWLMLLPVADVIATCSRLMLLPWWLMLYPPMGDVADVIAMVACWNGHGVTLILIQMLYVGPHQ